MQRSFSHGGSRPDGNRIDVAHLTGRAVLLAAGIAAGIVEAPHKYNVSMQWISAGDEAMVLKDAKTRFLTEKHTVCTLGCLCVCVCCDSVGRCYGSIHRPMSCYIPCFVCLRCKLWRCNALHAHLLWPAVRSRVLSAVGRSHTRRSPT